VPPAEAAPPPPCKAECEQAGPPLGEATGRRGRPASSTRWGARPPPPPHASVVAYATAAAVPRLGSAPDAAGAAGPRLGCAPDAAVTREKARACVFLLVGWGERLIRGNLVFFLLCLQILYFLNHLFYHYLTDIQSRGKRRIRFKITRAKSQSLKNKDKITVGLLEKGKNIISLKSYGENFLFFIIISKMYGLCRPF